MTSRGLTPRPIACRITRYRETARAVNASRWIAEYQAATQAQSLRVILAYLLDNLLISLARLDASCQTDRGTSRHLRGARHWGKNASGHLEACGEKVRSAVLRYRQQSRLPTGRS